MNVLELQRRRALVDLGSASAIALAAALVAAEGRRFAVLVFVTLPLIAVVQRGARRAFWLTLGLATCTSTAVLTAAPAGSTALRLAVAGAALSIPLVLTNMLDGAAAEAHELRRALEERKLVERAKGLLMPALGVSENDAHRRLQKMARERNLRLADVARQVIAQRSLLEAAATARAASPGRPRRRSPRSGRSTR